MSGTLYEGNQ